jgi:hypothetical protein
VKIVDEQGASLPDCPPLRKALMPFTSPNSWEHKFNLLVQLAASMRAHEHGGTLLGCTYRHGKLATVDRASHSLLSHTAILALTELMRQEVNDANEVACARGRATSSGHGCRSNRSGRATIINDQYEVLHMEPR